MMKTVRIETLHLEKIVGGGQALGALAGGKKCFVWGGLPGETVEVQITKSKSHMAEGIVTNVLEPSTERTAPRDADSYLSTSPWQIMSFEAEQRHKAALIDEAFELHHLKLPEATTIYSDNAQFGYRNKVEFSWYGSEKPTADSRQPTGEGKNEEGPTEDVNSEQSTERLDLAFYRRGTQGKIIVDGTSLARAEINRLARQIRDLLQRKGITARQLKTLLIRSDQQGNCAWQLYVKDEDFDALNETDAAAFAAQGGEVIYSDPRSPASRISKRLATFGNPVLTDTILGVPFHYATEGFFQVNIPVYEAALRDMEGYSRQRDDSQQPTEDRGEQEGRRLKEEGREADSRQPTVGREAQDDDKRVTRKGVAPTETRASRVEDGANSAAGPASSDLRGNSEGISDDGSVESKVVDLYSGVGTIGLTIGGDNVTLVEINEDAVREMRRNIDSLGKNAHAVLAASEKALEYIMPDTTVIVDPPRAGLHLDVVNTLLKTTPPRIIYLSCNPVTQARDVALLLEKYRIVFHRGYNFFPRTPHIEHLVVLDKISL